MRTLMLQPSSEKMPAWLHRSRRGNVPETDSFQVYNSSQTGLDKSRQELSGLDKQMDILDQDNCGNTCILFVNVYICPGQIRQHKKCN